MDILVTGAGGQLGRACVDAFTAAGCAVAGVDLADGDLADDGAAAALLARHAPRRVVNCAAYTAVDRAETEREAAERGNALAVARLAAACADAGAALTHISTDYVFRGDHADGYRESDPRDPVSWYGVTKARGEEAVERLTVPWQIVRTSWLFGHGPANFVLTMRRLLRERERLTVVDDQRGCPTYAEDLADLLVRLDVAGAEGIFHGTNSGQTTWFGLAREVAHLSGAAPERIVPCTTADYPTPARRPACSVLHETRLAGLGLQPLPHWSDAVARYVAWLDRNEERDEHDRP